MLKPVYKYLVSFVAENKTKGIITVERKIFETPVKIHFFKDDKKEYYAEYPIFYGEVDDFSYVMDNLLLKQEIYRRKQKEYKEQGDEVNLLIGDCQYLGYELEGEPTD